MITAALTLMLAVSCAAVGILFVLMRQRLSRRKLGPVAGFTLAAVVFIQVGFILQFVEIPRSEWASRAVTVVSLGILFFVLGGLLGTRGRNVDYPRSKVLGERAQSRYSYSSILMVAVVVYGACILYFVLSGSFPAWEALKRFASAGWTPGLMNTLRVGRDVYINPDATYIPLQGLLESIRYFGVPLVVVVFVDFWRNKVRRPTSAFLVVLGVGLSLASGQRWPLMYLLLSVIFYLTWSIGPMRRELKRAVARVVVIGGLLALGATMLLGRTLDVGLDARSLAGFAVGDLVSRIFLGNAIAPFQSYALFPQTYGLLYGASYIQNLRAYLPGPLESFPVTFSSIVYGTSGYTAPPDYFTEAYINFGILGVVVLSALLGYWYARVEDRYWSQEPSAASLAAAAVISSVLSFVCFSGVMFALGAVIALIIAGLTAEVAERLLAGSHWTSA